MTAGSETKRGGNGKRSIRPLECDLILKGGVTSGVVYPPAILRLAETFRFRSIGGASAGAIAAVLTAAAEFGEQEFENRTLPDGAGFEGLGKLNRELSKPRFMQARLRPTSRFRATLRAVFLFNRLSRLGPATKPAWLRFVMALLAAFIAVLASAPLGSLAGGVAFAFLAAPLARRIAVAVPALFEPIIVASAALGVVLGAATVLVVRLGGFSPAGSSGFGMCSGSAGPAADFEDAENLALTDWLHFWINRLAGRKPDATPLTFAELEQRGINLRLMSTNLSLSQALVLPLERGSRSFFFRTEDLREMFPPAVHGALDTWGRRNPTDKLIFPEGHEFLRFPFANDMPIVVGARLSLSFPLLLTAVRVHSFAPVAYDKAREGVALNATADLEDHWFSDGGITSNFPIHLFDTWLPQRPTFGITLYDSPVSSVLAQRDARERPQAVVLPRPRDFDLSRPPRTRISSTGDFLRAVFNAAQSHRDVAQSGLPSYRERIAQIFLEPHEGGLNLAMDHETIVGIQDKGTLAADELLARFRNGAAFSDHYLEHVWVRTLTLLGQLEKHFASIRATSPGPDWKSKVLANYRNLLDKEMNSKPVWYRKQGQQWNAEAARRIEALVELIDQWERGGEACFSKDPPRPEGRLRVTSET